MTNPANMILLYHSNHVVNFDARQIKLCQLISLHISSKLNNISKKKIINVQIIKVDSIYSYI